MTKYFIFFLVVCVAVGFNVSCSQSCDIPPLDYDSTYTFSLKNSTSEQILLEYYDTTSSHRLLGTDTLQIGEEKIITLALLVAEETTPKYVNSHYPLSVVSQPTDSVVVRFLTSGKCAIHQYTSSVSEDDNIFFLKNYTRTKNTALACFYLYTFTDAQVTTAKPCN